jgi:hypothetical protein
MVSDGLARAVFGARAQVVVGVATLVVGVGAWAYFIATPPTVGAVFHVSMFFGCVACYAIIATGLGYRKTEQVSTEVVEEIRHADDVTVNIDTE